MKIIAPDDYVDAKALHNEPFFYLVGPGTDWQDEVIGFLEKPRPESVIVLPFQYGVDGPYYPHVIQVDRTLPVPWYFLPDDCLNLAKRMGCVVYWLSWESQQALGLDRKACVETACREIEALIEIIPGTDPRISVGAQDTLVADEIAQVTGLPVYTDLRRTVLRADSRISWGRIENHIKLSMGMTADELRRKPIDELIKESEERNGHPIRFVSHPDLHSNED